MNSNYDDIINMERPVSKKHPPMPLANRAAQFAPFAALAGYEEMVDEEARITDREISLGDSELDLLDQQFRRLSDMLSTGQRPQVSVLVFIPDQHKAGGRYETVTGHARRLDPVEKKLVILNDDSPTKQITLNMDRILDLLIQ